MQEYDVALGLLVAVGIMVAVDLFKDWQVNNSTKSIVQGAAGYSLTLYLIHYSLFDFLVTNFSAILHTWQLFTLGVILSNLIALLFAYYTEMRYKIVSARLKQIFMRQNSLL